MLDAPIRIEGKMIGVICNETVGKYKKWTVEKLISPAPSQISFQER